MISFVSIEANGLGAICVLLFLLPGLGYNLEDGCLAVLD